MKQVKKQKTNKKKFNDPKGKFFEKINAPQTALGPTKRALPNSFYESRIIFPKIKTKGEKGKLKGKISNKMSADIYQQN